MTTQISPVPAPAAPRRILFLNDLGFQYGAGVAQARQMQSMLAAGWEVGALAWEPGGLGFELVVTRAFDPNCWLGLRRARQFHRETPMTNDEIIAGISLEVARFAPQVVIVGNVHGANWPLDLLPALATLGCRVIAYLHDGYFFTGRCPYPGSCNLYLTGCDERCPTATEYPAVEPALIAGQWNLRRKIFNHSRGIEVVGNSHWTRDMFRAALPEYRSCETVYLAADETVFQPGDKLAARQHLGLPPDKPVILCAAVNFHDKRKGASYLQEIIAAFKDTVTFAAFGHHAGEIPGLIGLGYHHNAHEIAVIYQAADIFLGTATEEAFGQTIMEAQLCGLPVVAFKAGGVAEIVRNELTGKLVPVGHTAGIIKALQSILGDAHFRFHSGVWARAAAVSRFSLENQAQGWERYLAQKIPVGTGRNPPSLSYALEGKHNAAVQRPSWPCAGIHVTAEHARIFELTSPLPGWQMPGDSFKLYEMGFWAGDVILEIGTYGGRSATVELRGALANPARTAAPQFYGIDISPDSIARTRQTLADEKLLDYCHLFEGSLADFVPQWTIEPTMVFLDGDHSYEGVVVDMEILSRYLRPGTPVLVHDYLNTDNDTGAMGVTRGANEWAASGKVKFLGCFGCSALYLTLDTPRQT